VVSNIDIIVVGDIVQEVNYIAYFNTPMKPRVGIVLKIYERKINPTITYSHKIAKVYWLKNHKFEAVPVYLLKHYEEDNNGKPYECEKI
jgi:hypothetical protein